MICLAGILSESPAIQLVDNSIAYHDPNDRWDKWTPELSFTVLFLGKPNGSRRVSFYNKRGCFQFCAQYEDGELVYQMEDHMKAKALWNDSENIPQKVVQQYGISNAKAVFMRDYYKHLYGMPMKLKDLGANIYPIRYN